MYPYLQGVICGLDLFIVNQAMKKKMIVKAKDGLVTVVASVDGVLIEWLFNYSI